VVMILRVGRLMASCFRRGGGELAGAKLYAGRYELSRTLDAKSGLPCPPSAPHIKTDVSAKKAAFYGLSCGHPIIQLMLFRGTRFPLLGAPESAVSFASGIVPFVVDKQRTLGIGGIAACLALFTAVAADRAERR